MQHVVFTYRSFDRGHNSYLQLGFVRTVILLKGILLLKSLVVAYILSGLMTNLVTLLILYIEYKRFYTNEVQNSEKQIYLRLPLLERFGHVGHFDTHEAKKKTCFSKNQNFKSIPELVYNTPLNSYLSSWEVRTNRIISSKL